MLKKERGVIPAFMAARILIHKKRVGRKPQARAKYIYNCQGRKLGRKRGSHAPNICIYIHAPRPQAGAFSRAQAQPHPITLGRKESPPNQTLHTLYEGWVRLSP
jgi:hypothetical protein